MKILNILLSCVVSCVILFTISVIVGIDQTEIKTDTFSPKNVERVRDNRPKEYALSQPVITIDPEQILCLQKNIYFESRNQSYRGRVATAWVTINRVNSTLYYNTICDVVYQGVHDKNGNPVRNKCKFSWYCDGKPDNPPTDNIVEVRAWEKAGELARVMYLNCRKRIAPNNCPTDPTDGALYYHTKKVAPSWSKVYTVSASIGSHIYYTRN